MRRLFETAWRRGRTRGVGLGLVVLLGTFSGPVLGGMDETSTTDPVRAAYRRPQAIPFPADNPYSGSKAELGRTLFFDPRLSAGNGMSCASCHVPALGLEDGQPIAFGEQGQFIGRHTPTLWNLAWGERFFWDGRAASLEEQALMPVGNPLEMGQDVKALLRELAADPDYPRLFAAAFPEDPAITLETLAKALATFERTLVSPPTPFDRWIAGEAEAISAAAKRGFALFTDKARCATCHSGWNFTDQAFHDIGLPGGDLGRGPVLGVELLNHAFKTPTLREIGRRAPYMHDGSLPDLKAVLDHYETGIVERPSLSPDLEPITLTPRERSDLLAFLATLDSAGPSLPDTPPAVQTVHPPAVGGAMTDLAEVIQRDKRFSRDRVALEAGGLLVVRNEDERSHNLRIFHPKLDFNSGIQKPGESAAVRFPETGSYQVFCGIHPQMELAVSVE